MSNDQLALALDAYRAELAVPQARTAESLQRILASRQRPRRTRPTIWIAVLAISGGAAATTAIWPRYRAAPHPAASGSTALPASHLASIPIAPPAASVAPVAEPPAPTAVAAAAPRELRSARRPHTSRAPTIARAPEEESDSAAGDPDDLLFSQIQKAHQSASVEADLAGWNRYLSSYPSGRFSPEARYRRALALARLGRGTEALSAFLWFTQSDDGAYRREDALRWVRALSAEP